jgi:hypothetical protein
MFDGKSHYKQKDPVMDAWKSLLEREVNSAGMNEDTEMPVRRKVVASGGEKKNVPMSQIIVEISLAQVGNASTVEPRQSYRNPLREGPLACSRRTKQPICSSASIRNRPSSSWTG